MNFTVTVPVKLYVKRFLENNFGNPVNFNGHPREKDFFYRMLKRPIRHYDSRYREEMPKFNSVVRIEITQSCFYQHGWELSRTDTVAFGKHFERNAKMLMRTMIGTYISFGMPVNIAITNFQQRFKMEEEYWSFESIQKDFLRFRTANSIDFNQYAFQHLEKLVLLNMTNVGVLSKSLVRNINSTSIIE